MSGKEPSIADEMERNDLWMKVAGVLCARLGGDVTIDVPEFLRTLTGNSVVVSHQQEGTVFRIRVLPAAEAQRLEDDYQRAARKKN